MPRLQLIMSSDIFACSTQLFCTWQYLSISVFHCCKRENNLKVIHKIICYIDNFQTIPFDSMHTILLFKYNPLVWLHNRLLWWEMCGRQGEKLPGIPGMNKLCWCLMKLLFPKYFHCAFESYWKLVVPIVITTLVQQCFIAIKC